MNWSEFLAMGGYAVYIWGAYAVTVVVVVVEVVLLILRRRNILRFLGRSRRRPVDATGGSSRT